MHIVHQFFIIIIGCYHAQAHTHTQTHYFFLSFLLAIGGNVRTFMQHIERIGGDAVQPAGRSDLLLRRPDCDSQRLSLQRQFERLADVHVRLPRQTIGLSRRSESQLDNVRSATDVRGYDAVVVVVGRRRRIRSGVSGNVVIGTVVASDDDTTTRGSHNNTNDDAIDCTNSNSSNNSSCHSSHSCSSCVIVVFTDGCR